SKWHFSLPQAFWSLHFGSVELELTPQWTLPTLYLVALILCARGAARHAQRRDPRLLIGIATPWLLMFGRLGQMHERYLLWGAVVGEAAVGVGVRVSVLAFVCAAMSAAMITQVLLMDKKLGPTLTTIDFLEHARPAASCLFLVCVGMYLREVLSVRAPSFRRVRETPPALGETRLALAVAVEEA